MEPEALSPLQSIWEHARESGPIGLAGLASMIVALVLLVGSPYFARSRCRLLAQIGLALFLGVGGYVAFDYRHLFLNLRMRDAQKVREDCDQLLARWKSTVQTQGPVTLSAEDLPRSFTRLGAKKASVREKTVHICIYPDSFTLGWGYLYDPQLTVSPSWRHAFPPMWYRDFYEFSPGAD